jgi:hypothetical protein
VDHRIHQGDLGIEIGLFDVTQVHEHHIGVTTHGDDAFARIKAE